ncbi:hypothetical protein PROFUN_09924 [Planoprotostelium fungivorum]|uniref:Uncharacterized protein n=1 Tax=Planoprotostelium fungivorum TaxID=1890364 RepID=A0A2P6NG90_9EUKA|nr:hypothetical protein PROFUN_09924 [Planoprotostelium fungivorum]
MRLIRRIPEYKRGALARKLNGNAAACSFEELEGWLGQPLTLDKSARLHTQ